VSSSRPFQARASDCLCADPINEPDRPFRAGHDTEAATLAEVGSGRVGRLHPVNPHLQAGDPGEAAVVGIGDGRDVEDIVGAHGGAIGLGLAPGVIDDRYECTRRRLTFGAGAVGVSRGALDLVGLGAFGRRIERQVRHGAAGPFRSQSASQPVRRRP
jgi:hypothetical protein